MNASRNKLGHALFALLVIAAGVLLFSYHTGVLPVSVKSIIFTWQTLLIAIGLVLLAQPYKRTPGVILIIIGTVFLLPEIFGRIPLFYGRGRALSWAVILILVGIFLLGKAIFGRSWCHHHKRYRHRFEEGRCESSYFQHPREHFSTRTPKDETGYVDRNFVFGGGKEYVNLPNFKGGEINCIFGGLDLDLSKAQLAPGLHTLEVSSVFGGVTICVPTHWKVEIRQTCVFGAFDDKRTQPYFDVEEDRSLIIVVNAVFGGGEIRSKQ
jgi:predicted membrane protein